MGRQAIYRSEAEAVEARRERQKARYQAMTLEQKQDYARRKNANKRRMPQMVIEPSRFNKPEPVRHEPESVDSFIARGGRIDLLPAPWEQAVS